MKLAAVAAVLLAGTATAALDLRTVVLKPAQVGKGYQLYARPDGFGVKAAPTLDLCGKPSSYPSEKLRADRLQVDYQKKRSKLLLSLEVVRYKPGGANQALREVRSHAVGCPHHPIATGFPGAGPLRFTITQLHDAKLAKGYVAVRVRAVGKLTNGTHVDQTSYAVYQRVGDVLSGVYSSGPNTRAQQAFALHAAEASARLLQKVAHAPKGPPA
ncbi:MAG TPA: hypothetical protein VFL60_06225 [Gaiellaceae bacterium]|nr:hypothetical protein [Gaiellaceae bacterium]